MIFVCFLYEGDYSSDLIGQWQFDFNRSINGEFANLFKAGK